MKLIDLPKELRDLALQRIAEQVSDPLAIKRRLKLAIGGCLLVDHIVWSKTPEGVDFWCYVNEKGEAPPEDKKSTGIAGFVTSEYPDWDVKYTSDNLILMIKNTP